MLPSIGVKLTQARMQIEGILEQDAEENILTQEEGSGGRREEITCRRASPSIIRVM
jgi:hypothetical protein